MDSNTLDNLKAAFNAAPSAQLASILVQHQLDKGFEVISPYLEHLSVPLDPELADQLSSLLFDQQAFAIMHQLLDTTQPAQALWLVRALVEQDQHDQAKTLYTQLVANHPSMEQVALNKTLGIVSDTRQKLRVVEKSTVADVADLAQYRQATTTFDDVVGLADIKKQIHKKIILPFQKPSLFARFKKKVGGGVLLYGPPGCGKTLLARATAGQCNATFFNIEISDVLDMYIGESENKLHTIFEKARQSVPCVLFFDELEALAAKREYNKGNASNVVSQFLTELDGFEKKNEGVLVLASTNVPWSIDSAFLRPGRFDRMFFVPPPDKTARESILEYYLKQRPVENDIDITALAAKTSGYSGADLENLIDMASDEAIDEMIETESDTNISYQHLKDALKNTRPTTTEWLTTARNYARYANDGGRYDDVLAFMKQHGK